MSPIFECVGPRTRAQSRTYVRSLALASSAFSKIELMFFYRVVQREQKAYRLASILRFSSTFS